MAFSLPLPSTDFSTTITILRLKLTMTWRNTHIRLNQAHHTRQPLPHLRILLLHQLLLSQHGLQLLIRLLLRQLSDLPLQTLDLILRPLSDRSLRLSIIRPLLS